MYSNLPAGVNLFGLRTNTGYTWFGRGLPLIMYASRGGGGVNPNAYKCVQGGRGGLNMARNMHFIRRLIESGIISAQRKVNG